MKVDIYDGPAGIILGSSVELAEAIGDDADELAEATAALERCGRYVGGGGAAASYYLVRVDAYATEPTDQGNQYVLPGCEKDRSRGPTQGDLF